MGDLVLRSYSHRRGYCEKSGISKAIKENIRKEDPFEN